MPANLHIPNREALLLPDRITPFDNLDLLPPPDAGLLFSQMDDIMATPLGRKGRVSHRDINLQEDFNNSQFLHDGMDKDDEPALANMDDLELDLDFGMDIDDNPVNRSVEVGRDAPDLEDDIFSDFGIPQQNKNDRGRDISMDLDFGDNVRIAADEGGDIVMGEDDYQFNLDDQSALPGPFGGPSMGRRRISESPLSDVNEEDIRQGEMEYSRQNHVDLYEPNDDLERSVVRKAPQRAKKQKILRPDEETMLSSAHIREQQAKHDNILKPQSFLSRNPYLLALTEMQKSNGFVSSIMLDGRSLNWAPELRGLLSLEAISRPNDLKRKRDSGIADMDSEQGVSKSPRLALDEDDLFAVDGVDVGNQTVAPDGTILEVPGDEGFHQGDDEARVSSPMAGFDETVAPLVHPADSGPVSLGTKHAVHILRDLFGAEAASNSEKRKKTAVVFQELLPEKTTTKADATKMFFECLVLATKDAIKVEQPEGFLGGPIRVRGKRGLWGSWAEREAGGEIATQSEPEPVIASGSAALHVAVEA